MTKALPVRLASTSRHCTLIWQVVIRALLSRRRSWPSFLSGFVEPVFYLAALGPGLGALVKSVRADDGTPLTYIVFIAPALLATSVMNGAVFDSGFTVFFKLRYGKQYNTMVATPVAPVDVVIGETVWSVLHGLVYGCGFMALMLVVGLTTWKGALLCLPAILLTGLAFGAAGMALATFMRTWQDADLFQLVIIPIFLFATTFFPIYAYPVALRPVAELLPLYQAVVLMRGVMTDTAISDPYWHIAYLVVMGVGGVFWATRRLTRILLS